MFTILVVVAFIMYWMLLPKAPPKRVVYMLQYKTYATEWATEKEFKTFEGVMYEYNKTFDTKYTPRRQYKIIMKVV